MGKTLSHAQVIARLRKHQKKLSYRDYAEIIGVSGPYLYQVMTGKRTLGPAILDYLGLEARTSSVTVYVEK